MARSILVDPEKLAAASKSILNQASEYERLYKALFTEVEGMGAAWQGIDNTAYVNQIKGFMDDFQQMTQVLRHYSEFLDSSAKTYKATQDDVVTQASRLTN